MTQPTHQHSLRLRIEQLEQELSALQEERDRSSLANSRWQALMDESPFGVAVYRPDGSVKAGNAGMQRLFELSSDEAEYAQSVYNILEDPQLAEKGLAETVHAAFSGRPAKLPCFEYDLQTPIEDKQIKKWLEGVFFPVLETDGTVREVVSIQMDVSDLMKAQEELSNSQAVTIAQLRELDHLYDVEPVGLCLVDRHLRYLRVNKKMAEINGLSPGQHLGKMIREVLPGIGDRIEALYKQVIETGEPLLNLEFHGSAPADPGTERDWLVNYYPVKNEDGFVFAVSCVVQEITEIKAVQEALEQSEGRFRQIAENIREVAWLLDLEKRHLTYASPAYESIWGRKVEELYSQPDTWDDNFHPNDLDRVNQFIEHLQEQGGSASLEVRIVRPDGAIRWVAFRAAAIQNKAGTVRRLVGTADDITEIKREEEERRRLETRIQQAQKFESLGLLAGGIAHDFNNLLMGVLGNADLALLSITPASPGHEYVERIQTAAQRASELANQMLAYSGKGKFVVEALSLNRVIHEMRHLLENVIPRQVRLSVDLAGELPPIEADASQMHQIVMNLVTNACEAIASESGVVGVSTKLVEADERYLSQCEIGVEMPPGAYVCLQVSDTGHGVSEEIRENIFDPFFTTKFTGRGLGLAATLGIVQSHGAALRVDSEPGGGATFSILFPPSSVTVEPVSEKPKEIAPETLADPTVLIVDDEAIVRDVARAMLKSADYNVLVACGGGEAIEIFEQHSDTIDLVILDMAMPEMDGRETYRKLRQIREDVLVVLSSGYSEEEAVSKLGSSGVIDFVHKPYKLKTLLDTVRKALEP